MNRRDFFRKAAEGTVAVAVVGVAHKVQAVENPTIEKPQLNVPLLSVSPDTENFFGIALEDKGAWQEGWVFIRSEDKDTSYRRMSFPEGVSKGDMVYTNCVHT